MWSDLVLEQAWHLEGGLWAAARPKCKTSRLILPACLSEWPLAGSSLDLLINRASMGINATLRSHLLCDPSDARWPSGESQRDFAGTSDQPTIGQSCLEKKSLPSLSPFCL